MADRARFLYRVTRAYCERYAPREVKVVDEYEDDFEAIVRPSRDRRTGVMGFGEDDESVAGKVAKVVDSLSTEDFGELLRKARGYLDLPEELARLATRAGIPPELYAEILRGLLEMKELPESADSK